MEQDEGTETASNELEEEEKGESHVEQVLKAYALGSNDKALAELVDSLFKQDKKDDRKEHEPEGN